MHFNPTGGPLNWCNTPLKLLSFVLLHTFNKFIANRERPGITMWKPFLIIRAVAALKQPGFLLARTCFSG